MYFYQKIIYYFCIFIGMCLEPRRMDDRYPEITMVKMFASFTISHNIDSLFIELESIIFIELESIMLSNTQGKLLLEIRNGTRNRRSSIFLIKTVYLIFGSNTSMWLRLQIQKWNKNVKYIIS